MLQFQACIRREVVERWFLKTRQYHKTNHELPAKMERGKAEALAKKRLRRCGQEKKIIYLSRVVCTDKGGRNQEEHAASCQDWLMLHTGGIINI